VNDSDILLRLKNWGIDGIITDYPTAMNAILKATAGK
jgi:glycerophosphoryl diester phosphodiesterase